FRDLQKQRDLLDAAVEHRLRVGDVCEPFRFADERHAFDLVMSHYIFDMWTVREQDQLAGFIANLSSATSARCRLLFAINAVRRGYALGVDDFVGAFESHGFRHVERRRTWDIYDLDEDTRERFLAGQEQVYVRRESLLLRLQRS